LLGCWSQGETEDEAIENLKDAIEDYLFVLNEKIKNADVRS
jgi:predicted RNase H-like HicB family nuclease